MLYKVGKNLEFKKAPLTARLYKLSWGFNLAIGILLLYGSFTPVIIYKTITKSVEVMVPEDIDLSDSAITAELVDLGCVLPNVALAQMKIESSHFKSAICKENKNIAGIRTSNSKYVKRDANGNAIKNRGHNVYDTYKDCLRDYIRIKNRYLKNIDGKYAEAPGYVSYIKKIK